MQQDVRAPVPATQIDLPPDPSGAAYAAYRQYSAPMVAIGLPDGAHPADFSVAATSWQLPGALLSRISSTAQLQRRGPAEIAADRAPPIMIRLQVVGRVDTTVGPRRFTAEAADVVILDFAKPFDSVVGPFTILAAFVARERVPPVFFASAAHGLHFPAGSPAASLIGSALAALVEVLDRATIPEAEAGLAALCGLAAGLIEAWLTSRAVPAGRLSGGADALRASAEAYIVERCSDPKLKPAEVARHLGISRSGLYRLFEGQGGVEAAIAARRLAVAVRPLLLGTGAVSSLRDMAAASGFGTTGRFLRAFEARFGTTPLRFRQQVDRRDAAWLADQARRAGFATHEAWVAALSADEGTDGEAERP